MSPRDKWGIFMILLTIVGAFGGIQSNADGSTWGGYLFGAALVYWMGTGFFKDSKTQEREAQAAQDRHEPPASSH